MTQKNLTLPHFSSIKRHFYSTLLLLAFSFSANATPLTQKNPTKDTRLTPHLAQKEAAQVKLSNLVLLDTLSTETEDTLLFKKYFSLPANLYCALLNLVAHGGYDTLFHLYNNTAASAITRSLNETGVNHYEVIEGKEETPIATLQYVDASEAKHLLCPDQSHDYDFDTTVFTDGSSSLLIKLGATYTSPSDKGPTYSNNESASWKEPSQEKRKEPDYYWIKSTTSTDNSQNLKYQRISGEVWISLPEAPSADTLMWHTQKNSKEGFKTKALMNPSPASITKTSHPHLDSGRTWGEWWEQRTLAQKVAIPFAVLIALIPPLIFLSWIWPTFISLGKAAYEAKRTAYTAKATSNAAQLAKTAKHLMQGFTNFACITLPLAATATVASTYWLCSQCMHFVNNQ